ncbi:caspase family protein [Streptomyces sp. NPDC054834]
MRPEPGAEHGAVGRRFLIAVGVGAFRTPDIAGLPGVEEDVRRVRELLEPMGYESVLSSLARDPSRAALAEGIEDWALETGLGPDDVVVVYFAGHGVHEDDRHYLVCADTRPGRWTRALAAEDLARPLVKSAVGHLLVILDTCYAAAGTADISRLASDLANVHRGRANRWHLAAARSKERAKENVFVDALCDVFAHPRHGATQQYVGVREVTERLNNYFDAHRRLQRARLTTAETDGQDPFFPSPLFVPGLPADGIDLASLAVLRRQHDGHFGPRSRGLEHVGERGDYFIGRSRAQQELIAFLTSAGTDHDRKARVVTGDPGSGKSALLGRLLALSDPDTPKSVWTALGDPQAAAFPHVIALHARRAALEDLAAELAAALRLPSSADRDDVLAAMVTRTTAVAVVVDSLDEAGTAGDSREAARIARDLLQPLSTLPAVRLVVGTRRPQISSLGHAVHILDLDKADYIAEGDVAAYAFALLEDAQDPDSRSPYRHRRDLAAEIADGIAARAGSSYLVARMTARALVHGQIDIDTTQPGWRERLPSDANEAFAAYLDRFGPDRPKVERLLRPLAYAQGAGLPWSTLWAPLAEALSGVACPHDDLDWLHRHAGAYIVETATHDGSAYRLFHETMAEHLRRPGHQHDDHATIARTLTALAPRDEAADVNGWPAAHPYIRQHTATHAASGGILPALLDDPEFLVHANPHTLLRALDTFTGTAHPTADIYRASAAVHIGLSPTARRDVLATDAARYQEPAFAVVLARTRPWTPRWATGTLVHPALRITFAGHAGPVSAVAVAQLDGRPHAVTVGHDRTVRVWDLNTGTQRLTLIGHTGWVKAVAVAQLDGRPHAITAGNDCTVRVWDLTMGTERVTLTGHTDRVNAVAVAQLDGRLHAITASDDRTVRLWDITTGTELAAFTDHTDAVVAVAMAVRNGRPEVVTASDRSEIRNWNLIHRSTRYKPITRDVRSLNAMALAMFDGRPHAVTAGDDRLVVLDLISGRVRNSLSGHHSGAVRAVATVQLDGRLHAVAAGDERSVTVWDLATNHPRADFTGHTGPVTAVAATVIDGRPHAITASRDGTVRVWDLTTAATRNTRPGHTNRVSAVAVAMLDGQPHAVTAGDDPAVRVWDLARGTARVTYMGRANWLRALAVAQLDGRPFAATADHDQTVRMWDLATGATRATPIGRASRVSAMAVAMLDGRPHAVTGGENGAVRVWDVATGTERCSFTGHADEVNAVAVTQLDGSLHAVSVGNDRTVRVSDLSTGTDRNVFTGHTNWVRAVAVAQIHGQPYAITAGDDQTVRVWDLVNDSSHFALMGHTGAVRALAVAQLDGRPHAVTAADDRTVRVWDLLANRAVTVLSQPLPVQAIAAYGDCILLGMGHEVVVLQHCSAPHT